MQEFFDKIKDLDLVSEISKHADLKRTGANYVALCPLHKENTPSFTVSPGKGIYRCYGCGKGGSNPGNFLMQLKGYSWMEACVELAKANQIDIPNVKERTPEEEDEYKKSEAIKTVLKAAMAFFEEELQKNKEALFYVQSRWTDDTIKLFNIGYAPEGNELYKWARSKGYKTDLLLDADLVKISKRPEGGYYDSFRDRIMFPMCDKYGRPVGFSGRILPKKDPKTGKYVDPSGSPKYVNSKESEIFQKGKMFYGFHLAQRVMRDKKTAYLVEGHPDVIRMHEIDNSNTVATSGTALTPDQVRILKSLVDSVNIIGDTDAAGQKAIKRSAEMLIKEGLFVNVVLLPEGEKKHDPDSFFTTSKAFDEYVTGSNIQDYIYMKAADWKKKANNPDFKKRAMDEICELVSNLPATVHGMYLEQLSKIIPSRKVWDQALKAVMKNKEPKVREKKIPDHVKLADFEKYGTYEDHNCYYSQGQGGSVKRVSNFVMKPLFHIVSVSNAKRLFEMTNAEGYTTVIEFQQKDLVSLSRFRERIEGLGNFLWEGTEADLYKLKRYLYEKTESCLEIIQLGWQKKYGFWAWSNGIFNGQFKQTDSHGIVSHDDKNFYLPAFSSIYEGESGLFTSERMFIHREYPGVSLNEFTQKLIDVFGVNAKFGICFYLATLFRDYIAPKVNNEFPILNIFGPKGTGKTQLALSLLQLFGNQPKGLNINSTSKPALADHVAKTCNALCHIDEYKNNLEFEKIEFLKGLYDGTGRSRMNMDKDKKTETTAVDSGIILTGQERATADNALFSRLVYLTFAQTTFSDEEQSRYNNLKNFEKQGITHITHEILSYRDYFINHFTDNYEKASNEIKEEITERIEDRTFKNWLILVAAFRTLKDLIKVPFSYVDLVKEASIQIVRQNIETSKSNEITAFWNTIQYLVADNLITEGVDYRIEHKVTLLKTDIIDASFNDPIDIIYLHYDRIMTLYSKHGKLAGEKVLPRDSMEYYLENDKNLYLGKGTRKLDQLDSAGNIMYVDDNPNKKAQKAKRVKFFRYDLLDIDLRYTDDISDSSEITHSKQQEIEYGDEKKDDLPF